MKKYLILILLSFNISIFANVVDSLFYQSVLHGDIEKATYYLKKGADINAIDETGAALLHRAALYSNINVAKWLLDRGADIDMQVGQTRLTPLMLAAHQQDIPICQYLVERGASIDIKDKNGLTASDYAYRSGYLALANYLKNPRIKLEKPYLAELISQAATAFSNYNYDEAIRINKILCKRLKDEVAPDNILYTKGLNDLGMCYVTIGDYQNAKKYLKDAVTIAQKYSPNSNTYYTRLVYYAAPFFNNAEYDEAFGIYLDCLQNIQHITDKQIVWTIYNNIGVIANHWGQYELAEKTFTKAVDIGKAIYMKDSNIYAMYAFAMGNLGGMYMERGQADEQIKAEHLLETALSIYSTHNDYGREYFAAYKNYGTLLANNGNYVKARQIYTEFLNSVATIYGTEHDEYAYALDALAVIDIHESKYDDALSSLMEAKAIREHNNSLRTPQGASLLINLGDLCERIEIAKPNQKTSAEDYYKDAINILETTIGQYNLKYAGANNYLGAYYYLKGQYSESIERQKISINIMDSIIGRQNQHYLTFYANLCSTYQAENKWDEALSNWQIFDKEFREYINNMFPIMSDIERTTFWNAIFQWRYESILPSLTYYTTDSIIGVNAFTYDNTLFTKGLLLSSLEQIKTTILNSGDNELIQLWNTLNQNRATLYAIQEQNQLKKSLIDSLSNEINKLEKYLSQKSREFQNGQNITNITWKNVQSNIGEYDIAIEFVNFNLWNHYTIDTTIYAALIIDKHCIEPIFIPIFEENEALPLINTSNEIFTNRTYGFRIANEDDAIGSDGAIAIGDTIGNGMKLSNLVWNKILPHIRNGETVYFAPSGLLHQLAIEALPYDETHTMADMFNLVRLSSTREIVLHKDELKHTTATLYGGIQYNMSSDELLAESEQYSTTNLLASRGIENDTLNRGSVRYLPKTQTEVENINRMLKENNLQVQLYTSTNGNEESFKSLSGKHQNILHIATHGFFWTDSTAHKKDYFSQRMLMLNDNMPQPPAIDPLNRCGLLFAGANTALQGHSNELPEGVQDGILTAKEISLLDLRDADLVVLSACETGKGEITGEGVFGLQRAFKQAGAQTIIISLWPVNDAATQLMMTEFYRNWITLNQPKRTAFRNAQKIVRQRYENPSFWAGFIMLD